MLVLFLALLQNFTTLQNYMEKCTTPWTSRAVTMTLTTTLDRYTKLWDWWTFVTFFIALSVDWLSFDLPLFFESLLSALLLQMCQQVACASV